VSDGTALLEVRDLTVSYPASPGGGLAGPARAEVVRGLSYEVAVGEAVALVGESGAGKSTSQLALLGLLPPGARVDRGAARLRGRDLLALSPRALRAVRGAQVGVVFQDPLASLNPYYRLGRQLVEAVPAGARRREARALALEMLARVGLAQEGARVLRAYPHELSGGMRQRVQLAMVLLGRPALLIADEPTTALDVTSQAQILALFRSLRGASRALRGAREGGAEPLSLTLITHDLAVAAAVADRVLVLYAGEVVEEAPTAAIFARPTHPYTRALLAAIPRLDGPRRRRLPVAPPCAPEAAPGAPSPACAFAPRCPRVEVRCRQEAPPLRDLAPPRGAGASAGPHRVRCHVASGASTRGEA